MTETSIREQYERHGVKAFYEQFGDDYRNPHEAQIQVVLRRAVQQWSLPLDSVLDLACGSGEATLELRRLGCTHIDGIDPYTARIYEQRTGQHADPYTFEQIADGILSDRQYSLMVCSFALHLVADSRLPMVAYQLSLIGDRLLIITPHKRPILKPAWGWIDQGELVIERVRARCYQRSLAVGRVP